MKKGARRLSRELVVQALYAWQMNEGSSEVIEADVREAVSGFEACDLALFRRLFTGVITQAEALQQRLTPFVDRTFNAISPVEKSVLWIAAFELIHEPAVPYRVVMNEAIELAKLFGGTDGHKYVNGVLDKLASQARASEIQRPDALGLKAPAPRVSHSV